MTNSEETVKVVWSEFLDWSQTSMEQKQFQKRFQHWAITLGVSGALFATIAGREDVMGAIAPQGATEVTTKIIGGASAVLLGLAAYIGRSLLVPEREQRWARGRVLAEALKREVWRFLIRVPPYDGDDAAGKLQEKSHALAANTQLEKSPAVRQTVRQTARQTVRDVDPPEATSVEDYISDRVRDQIDWYEDRSRVHGRELRRLKGWALFLGALSMLAALSVSVTVHPALPAFVPFLTTTSGFLVALMQSGRLQTIVPLYQETATHLRLLEAGFRDKGTMDDRAKNEFVEACESVMARENDSWRADWMNESAARRLIAELEGSEQRRKRASGDA